MPSPDGWPCGVGITRELTSVASTGVGAATGLWDAIVGLSSDNAIALVGDPALVGDLYELCRRVDGSLHVRLSRFFSGLSDSEKLPPTKSASAIPVSFLARISPQISSVLDSKPKRKVKFFQKKRKK